MNFYENDAASDWRWQDVENKREMATKKQNVRS